MSKPTTSLTLDRTLKWLDKTGTVYVYIQRVGISSVKLSNMHVDSLNINMLKKGIKLWKRKLMHFFVLWEMLESCLDCLKLLNNMENCSKLSRKKIQWKLKILYLSQLLESSLLSIGFLIIFLFFLSSVFWVSMQNKWERQAQLAGSSHSYQHSYDQ